MKVLNLILMLVLCSNVYAVPRAVFVVNIKLVQNENRTECVLDKNADQELIVEEGGTVEVGVGGQEIFQKGFCQVTRGDGTSEVLFKEENDNGIIFFLKRQVTKDLAGMWKCELSFDGPNSPRGISPNKHRYMWVMCEVKVTVKAEDNILFITWCAVAVVIILIIVGQTIALLQCYFKSKSRYSAAPSLRSSKANRAAADTDSHIYEMVGVNALYKDSSKLEIIDNNNKNRPPLPLPGETSDPAPSPVHINTFPRPLKKEAASIASTLSVNSASSSSQPKAAKPSKDLPKPEQTANRPPKPDKNSLPGSLQRPPKALPKSGSVPKTIVKDPGLMELKNALKKRNPITASPNSSPMSTMKKKQPMKPLPKQIVQPTPKPQPVNSLLPPIKPATMQPSEIKAKLEATLKPMTRMGLIQASPAASAPPVRPNPPGVSPVVPSTARPSLSHVRPNLPIASASPVKNVPPPVNRPLPVPHLTSRPLPPIQQDDLNQSDDEEWTYEPLQQFNLYNM